MTFYSTYYRLVHSRKTFALFIAAIIIAILYYIVLTDDDDKISNM